MIEIDHFNWILALMFFGITAAWTILGVLCNLLLIVTTIKTKTMRTTCNVLIAICALSDILHEFGTLAQFPSVLDPNFEISSSQCVAVMFLPGIGIAMGCACILCVGLDRMFSVIFLARYRAINRVHYNAILAFMIFVYCLIIPILMTTFYQEGQVTCEILTPYPGQGVELLVRFTLFINTTSAVVYFITWIGLRRAASSDSMKRIVKSLFIIVTVDISGWIITPGMFGIFLRLGLNDQQLFAWGYFSRIFINIALAVKMFIYYTTSTEYRSAIKAVIRRKKANNLTKTITWISVTNV